MDLLISEKMDDADGFLESVVVDVGAESGRMRCRIEAGQS